MPPKEAHARIKINQLLADAGWRLLDTDADKANVLLENHVKITRAALDELGNDFEKTSRGFVDYLLLGADGFPLAVLEAKAENKNPLDGKEQARAYAQAQNCRFVILSNGKQHYWWDIQLGNPQLIIRFPSPVELAARAGATGATGVSGAGNTDIRAALIREQINRDYIVLTQKPDYANDPSYQNSATREAFNEANKLRFLRKYQIRAVRAIQDAVASGRERFLFEMATGTGKTLIAGAVIRMFLRSANARRVLFLVDRIELENQAQKAFAMYLKNDFRTVIYKEARDAWRNANIVVSTIQTLLSRNHYLCAFAPDDFDLVISDEAHRSIGGNRRAVFAYFSGYKLGLTATPKDYLKNRDPLAANDPREIERRELLDSYKTFGCESGEPTFRYSLIDGVRDGFLINPLVIDARTKITTQLLAEDGYAVALAARPADDDGADETGESAIEKIFAHIDFEKKFFSDPTNAVFCRAFMDHALRDPISGEIGKTIIFCVSQNHAAKIAQQLRAP